MVSAKYKLLNSLSLTSSPSAVSSATVFATLLTNSLSSLAAPLVSATLP